MTEKKSMRAMRPAKNLEMARRKISASIASMMQEPCAFLAFSEANSDRPAREIVEVSVVSERGEVLYESAFFPALYLSASPVPVEELLSAPLYENEHGRLARVLAGRRVISLDREDDRALYAATHELHRLPEPLRREWSWHCASTMLRVWFGGASASLSLAKQRLGVSVEGERAYSGSLSLLGIFDAIGKMHVAELDHEHEPGLEVAG